MLTIAVLDIYSFSPFVLHKYSFLRIKIPSFFYEKVRFLNILFIPSILPCIKKSVGSVRSVCDPFAQFRMPVPFITIRLIRARIIFLEQSYSFNSFEIYFLKHQDSFNSFNSCSKKIKFVFKKTRFVFHAPLHLPYMYSVCMCTHTLTRPHAYIL